MKELKNNSKNLTPGQVIEFCDETISTLKQNIYNYLCSSLIGYVEKHKLYSGVFSNDNEMLSEFIPEFTNENAIKYGNSVKVSKRLSWWEGNEHPNGFDVNNRIIFLEWIKSQYINNNIK